jgi:filamentous hemagglutinin
MSQYGTGSQLQRAAQAVTAALQGLAGGDIGAALAGASAPYLANTIKQLTEGDREVQLMAHAVLGALVAQAQGNSAIAGAAGAATGEAMASVIAQQLYGKNTDDLSESEKQAVVALSSLAGGLAGGVLDGSAGGAVAGAKGGQNAVENNEFGGRLYVDHVFEAYVQGGGCHGGSRQQCRTQFENTQLANGGLETAAAFALLPFAIAGAALTPAMVAAARAGASACAANPPLCVTQTTNLLVELGLSDALPTGILRVAGAKLTYEQASKIRAALEVEQQTGQKLSADAVASILTEGGGAKATANAPHTPRFIADSVGNTIDLDYTKGLRETNVTVTGTRGGVQYPLQGQTPDSYANLGNGHVVVYGPEGRALYDVSSSRIKVIEWNQAPNGTYFPKKGSDTKAFEGSVPQSVLDILGLK